MHVHRQLVRLALTIAMSAGLLTVPATPGLAGSLHATILVFPLTPTLTLSDSTGTRVGLIKVKFATLNTNATHTLVTISAQPPVTVANGTTLPLPSNCVGTGSPPLQTTPVMCSLGSISPNTSAAPILIEFQSPTLSECGGVATASPPCQVRFTASATYSLGTLSSTESITDAQNVQLFLSSQNPPAAGNCPNLSAGSTASLSTTPSSSVPQAAQVTFGAAAKATGNPCTPGAAGAQAFPQGKPASFVLNQVWFVDLPQLDSSAINNNGLAAATLQVSNLPTGTNKNNFVLQEFTNDLFSGKFDATQFSPVPPCAGSPLQPPAGRDSCISSVSTLPGGGLSISLILNPAAGDASYGG
jgi:hypothetical protein